MDAQQFAIFVAALAVIVAASRSLNKSLKRREETYAQERSELEQLLELKLEVAALRARVDLLDELLTRLVGTREPDTEELQS